MYKKSNERRINLTLLNDDGSIRVNDSLHFWREEVLDWRYNFCHSFEENEKSLLLFVYGDEKVKCSLSPELEAYLKNRKDIQTKISNYIPIINSIKSSEIPLHMKNDLLNKINNELHKRFPYV